MAGFERTGQKENYTWKILIMRMIAVFGVLTSVFGAYLSVFAVELSLQTVMVSSFLAILAAMLLGMRGKYWWLRALAAGGAVVWIIWKFNDRLLGGLVPYVDTYVELANQFYRSDMPLMLAEMDKTGVFFIQGFVLFLFATILWVVLEWKKGKIAAIFLMLLPVILSAVIGEMPELFWCWCLMAAGSFYLIICHMSAHRIPLRELSAATIVLVILWIVSSVFTPFVYKYKEEHLETYKEVKKAIINSQQIDWDEISAKLVPESENFGGSGNTDGQLANLTGFYQTGKKITEVVLKEKPTKAVYHRDFIGAYYTGEAWLPPETEEYSSELYIDGYNRKNLEELSAICQNMVQSSPEQTATVIGRLLSAESGFRYVQNPGKMPEDRGFVEGFLFEKKEGFCVHFATTATIIYRLCGWPARYVEGYRIEPEAFVEQSDGTYKAVVTDYMGHAWCETYEGSAGWKVREHTIASVENELTPTATLTPDNIEETPPENQNPENEQDTPEASNTEAEQNRSGQFSDSEAALWKMLQAALGMLCILTGLMGLIFLQQKLRRSKTLAGFRIVKANQGILNIYNAIFDICEYAGRFTFLSEEEWAWVSECAQWAAYSGELLSREERKEMYRLYQVVRNDMLRGLSKGRKFFFLYIKAL